MKVFNFSEYQRLNRLQTELNVWQKRLDEAYRIGWSSKAITVCISEIKRIKKEIIG